MFIGYYATAAEVQSLLGGKPETVGWDEVAADEVAADEVAATRLARDRSPTNNSVCLAHPTTNPAASRRPAWKSSTSTTSGSIKEP